MAAGEGREGGRCGTKRRGQDALTGSGGDAGSETRPSNKRSRVRGVMPSARSHARRCPSVGGVVRLCQPATASLVRVPPPPPPLLRPLLPHPLSLSLCASLQVQGRGRSVLPAAQVVRPRVHHTSRKRELLVLVWKGSDHMRRRSPCGAQQTGEVRGGERRRSSRRRGQQGDEATK